MKRLAHNTLAFAAATFLFIGLPAPTVYAENPTPGFNCKILESIMTADKVETSIGTLEFYDGLPSRKTTQKVFETLNTARGMEVFLNMIPAASVEAMHIGNPNMGVKASN